MNRDGGREGEVVGTWKNRELWKGSGISGAGAGDRTDIISRIWAG